MNRENLDDLSPFDRAFLKAFEENKSLWLDLLELEADEWDEKLDRFNEKLTEHELQEALR